MTGGKKLTIALAVAIPLLILGSGIALAAGDEPNLTFGERSAAPAYAVAPVSTATTTAPACEGCTGPCQGNAGLCSGNCNGECDQDCTGVCDGDCAASGDCYGQRSGAGNCGNTIEQAAVRSCHGSGCGQRLAVQSDSTPACTSCDVVGLNFEKPCLLARTATSA